MHQATLAEAIRMKRNVAIRYDDDVLERAFSPYIIYRSSTGKLTVAGNQVHNPAGPSERNEWRNLTIAKLRNCRVMDRIFIPDARFNPFDKRYAGGVVCHVKQNV